MKTLFIEPGSPWENGYCESFNSKLRDELLNGEMFTTLREAQVLIEMATVLQRRQATLFARIPTTAPEAILSPAHSLPYASLLTPHGLAKRPAGL